MKKYLAIFLGAVFVLGFAASAFAIHAEIPAETQAVVAKGASQITIGGELRFRGEVIKDAAKFTSGVGDTAAYYDSRVRLSVDAQLTPNTEGFIQLEAGSGDVGRSTDLWYWGNNDTSNTPKINGNAQGIYSTGDSKRGTFSVLQAWIQHSGTGLLGIPAGFKVGHMPLALGYSLFFDHTKFGDDALLFFADPMKELHLVGLTAKFREGEIAQNDDATAWVALFSYATKTFGISGDATYVDDQDSKGQGLLGTNFGANTPIHFWNFGLRGNASVAGFGLKGDVEFQTGKIDDATKLSGNPKFRGWAAMGGASYKIDPVTVSVDVAYGSGDDKGTDGKIKDLVTSLSYAQHYTYVYEYRTDGACKLRSAGLCNTFYAKAGLDGNVTKELSGLLNVYWLRAAKKFDGVPELGIGAPTTSRNIGWEIDGRLAYKIDRNLTYFVEGGYLFAGDFFRNRTTPVGSEPEDAYAVRHGIQLSF